MRRKAGTFATISISWITSSIIVGFLNVTYGSVRISKLYNLVQFIFSLDANPGISFFSHLDVLVEIAQHDVTLSILVGFLNVTYRNVRLSKPYNMVPSNCSPDANPRISLKQSCSPYTMLLDVTSSILVGLLSVTYSNICPSKPYKLA